MDEEIDTTDLPPQNSLEQYYGFAHPILPDSTSNCAGAQWCVVQIWKDIPRTPSIISLGICPNVGSMHTSTWGYKTTEYDFGAMNFGQNGLT